MTARPRARPRSARFELRGPNLFREYWRKPDATREAFASGWFDTGDLGSRDAAGFLTLVGRKNDLIITNGFNVYPQVVERVINECPGVRESAVRGRARQETRRTRGRGRRPRATRRCPTAHSGPISSDRLVDYQRPADGRFRRGPAAQCDGKGPAARSCVTSQCSGCSTDVKDQYAIATTGDSLDN